MGDIFCLIILESGSRRKLRLHTGTYDELLGSLAGIVEVSNNTLVQIFDTDLDDFVDLLPGDIVPNKAKLRVIQKASSAWCEQVGNAVLSSPQPQPMLQIVSASSMAVPQLVEQKRQEPTVFPSCTSGLDVSMDTSAGEALLDAADAGDDETIDFDGDTLDWMTGDEQQENESAGAVVEDGGSGDSGDAFRRLSQMPEVLRAMLPRAGAGNSLGDVSVMDIVPAREEDPNDYLKFVLPSFGTWCDIILRRNGPITMRIRRHIINTLFKACFKITLYPTRRLYRNAIDSLVFKYPHLISGPNDWQRWCFALRSKFKNTRRRFPETAVKRVDAETRESPKGGRKEGRKRTLDDVKHALATKRLALSDIDERLNTDGTPECSDGPAEPGNLEAAPFQAKSERVDEEEEQYSCPDISDAVSDVEDEDNHATVAGLLSMCTGEAAAKALAESPPSRQKSAGKPHEEAKESSEEEAFDSSPEQLPRSSRATKDYLKFKLPPFTALQDELNGKEPLTGSVCRRIINSLYDVCSRISLYPSACLYRTAVDSLLRKYPHLRGSDEETSRQLWVTRLRSKFKNFRRSLPDEVLHMHNYGGKWSSVAARRLGRKNAVDDKIDADAVRRASRAVHFDQKLLAAKLKTSQRAASSESSAATVDNANSEIGQLLESKKRHDLVKEMSVEQAITIFPCYRQESSLLAEFKALWKVDIAECFEKGITRLFRVLMDTGTPQEIMVISEADGDILLVVLETIAKRCREKITALLAEGTALPAPCLLKRPDGSYEVFVDGFFLFTASSLLGGICALFASFWVFHIEYPKDARSILTFLEHAFLDLNFTKPHLKAWELINLYRSSSPRPQEREK